jgi:hypothetical protein
VLMQAPSWLAPHRRSEARNPGRGDPRSALMACPPFFCAGRYKFVVNRGRGARHEAPLPGQPGPHYRVPKVRFCDTTVSADNQFRKLTTHICTLAGCTMHYADVSHM